MVSRNNQEINKLAYLNLLKFICAIIIAVFYHNFFLSQYVEQRIPVISFLHGNARLIVEMFFLISGMLFYKAYYSKLINNQISYSSLLKKRILNTYVLATITTLYVFLIDFISFKINDGTMYRDGTLSLATLAIALLFGGGTTLFEEKHVINGPAWFLTSLLFTYLIALLLTFIVSKMKNKESRANKLMFIIPITVGTAMFLSGKQWPLFWNLDIARGLMFFFLGIYVMMFLEKYDCFKNSIKLIIKIIALMLTGFFIYVLTNANLRNTLALNSNLAAGYIFFPVLIIALYDIDWLNKFCSLKFIKSLTSFSFEIYLMNYPIHATMYLFGYRYIDFAVMGYWFLLFDAVMHLILGYLTYLLVTKKLTNFIKKIPSLITSKKVEAK